MAKFFKRSAVVAALSADAVECATCSLAYRSRSHSSCSALAGLFLKSFRNSLATNPGFDHGRHTLANVDLAGRGYSAEAGRRFLDQLVQRLETMPGVERASTAGLIPLDIRGINSGVISVEGAPDDPNRNINFYNVTSGYFATMDMVIDPGARPGAALAHRPALRRRHQSRNGAPFLARRFASRPPFRNQRRLVRDHRYREKREVSELE